MAASFSRSRSSSASTLDWHSLADEIALTSTGFGPGEPFAADGGGAPVRGWSRYAQAVAVELALLGRPPVGLAGSISSDLPAGAGLSSSAALEVAVALALCAVADFELEPLQLALACQRAELRAVGVPCGILDQAACLLGRASSAILLDCCDARAPRDRGSRQRRSADRRLRSRAELGEHGLRAASSRARARDAARGRRAVDRGRRLGARRPRRRLAQAAAARRE